MVAIARGTGQLAQRHHMHEQVAFLDHELAPHQIHQLALGHHPPAPLDERNSTSNARVPIFAGVPSISTLRCIASISIAPLR